MPWRGAVLDAKPDRRDRDRRWGMAIVWIASMPLTIASIARLKRGDWAAIWTVSRDLAQGFLLIAAAACLLAAIVGGAVAWRRAASESMR